MFGHEEEDIIKPAIKLAKKEGIIVNGPLPPDTVFFKALQGYHDAVVCMYHDQGLGPLKALYFDESINVSLGLPIIRTSVDHGTAFDIAGKNMANELSMRSALYLAVEIFKNRKFNKQIHANPLPFSKEERGKKESDRPI